MLVTDCLLSRANDAEPRWKHFGSTWGIYIEYRVVAVEARRVVLLDCYYPGTVEQAHAL